MNALASELGVSICALPTGQGLIVKPARSRLLPVLCLG